MYNIRPVKTDYSFAIDIFGGLICVAGCVTLMFPNKFLLGAFILMIGVLITMRPIKI